MYEPGMMVHDFDSSSQEAKVVCECQTIQSYIEKPYREKKKEYTIL